MSPKMSVQLPTPWHITYHEFYDEPGESEDLFQAELKTGGDCLLLDAGWYGDHYKAVLIKNYDWQNPVELFRTTERNEVVAWLQQTSQQLIALLDPIKPFSVTEQELIHFFEVLPIVLKENCSWPDNNFAFEVQQGDLALSFTIYPIYQNVHLILKHQGQVVYEFNGVDGVNVIDVQIERYTRPIEQSRLEIVLPAGQKLLIYLKPTLQIKHTFSAA